MAAAQNGYHKSHPDLNRDLTMDSGAETRRVAQNVWTEREKKKKCLVSKGNDRRLHSPALNKARQQGFNFI